MDRGTLVTVLAPIFGAYIVALLYFLVNRDHSRRVPTTGYALGALGVVQGVVTIGYAFAARSILVAVVGIVLPAILLVAWYVSE